LILLLIAIIWVYKKTHKQQKELQFKNELINRALSEKDMLLKEIHHRVKNNLQIISSLLSIQSRYIKDEKALEAINESKERVNAISLLHQEIYQNDVLKLINAKVYLENLVQRIKDTFNPENTIKIKHQY
jgi:two-component sensor histidine kinase